jgi:GntR family transcriptional regulator / MocR family aminotransferase
MLLIKDLIVLDASLPTPRYLQITNAVVQHIHHGRLKKGQKLPGTREMETLLQVNRMTVVAAYQELEAQGWIETVPRKGTFIKVDLPVLYPKKINEAGPYRLPDIPGFDYDGKRITQVYTPDLPPTGKIVLHDGGFPDVRIAPIEDLARRVRSLSRIAYNKKHLMYGNAQGTLYLRETLAAFLCDTRGLSISAENILITKGAQMGLYIASSILLKEGEEVVVGTPGYMGANATFQQAGARINHARITDSGIDVDTIENICKKKKIRMVYVIPHHHHPTSSTLSPEKRMRLLALAAKFKFAIIEDDYDYDFHYDSKPMMPMASLDRNGNVIYIGTLTKSLAPAIRLGFIVAPSAFIQSAKSLRKFIDSHGDSLIENAIAELYKDGTIARHLKKSIKLYRERRDHFCELLKNEVGKYISFRIPDGGMSVWTTFLQHHLPAVSALAFDKGLIMRDGTDYNTRTINYNAVGLGFASVNFKEQEKAVEILKSVLQSKVPLLDKPIQPMNRVQ